MLLLKKLRGIWSTYKYKYIYKVIVNNINQLTKRAELYVTGDGTSWSTASHDKAGAEVTLCFIEKLGILMGGQTLFISETHYARPWGYIHCHKSYIRPRGWNAIESIDCKIMFDTVKTTISGYSGETVKIHPCRYHFAWDNHFSGDQIVNYSGKEGVGPIRT